MSEICTCAKCGRFLKTIVHRYVQKATEQEKDVIASYEKIKALVVAVKQKKANLVGLMMMPELKDLVAELEGTYRKDRDELKKAGVFLQKIDVKGQVKMVRDNLVRYVNETLS